MRIKLKFTSNSDSLMLPVYYNYLIQSMIYRHLEQSLADWLHEEGFRYYKRKFKLFTFSRLLGKYKLSKDRIIFEGPVILKISSPYVKFLESLAEHLVKMREIQINRQKCTLESIEVEMRKQFSGPVLIKMLSPLTVYSTLRNAEGKKKTYYYTPWEDEFNKLILENIRKKTLVFYGNEDLPPLDGSYIKPIRVDSKRNFHILKFKDTVIHGWSGHYELNLPDPYLSIAYDAGLGAKNSQGMGMWDIVERGSRNGP